MAGTRLYLLVVALAVVVLALGVLGPMLMQHGPGPYTPEVAGVVVSTEPTEANFTRFILQNGHTFDVTKVDGSTTRVVYGLGPAIGELLLGGSSPGGPWMALVRLADPTSYLPNDCYRLDDNGTDQGDWIETDLGLRLRKAADFNPGLLPDTPGGPVPTAHAGLRYDGVQRVFCLNSEGQVIARR